MRPPGPRPTALPTALAALLVAATLAGCGSDGPVGPFDSTSSGPASDGFDGQATLGFAQRLVTAADGSPAFRVPGTPAHREAAERLRGMMQVDGWSVEWQNFTGAQYQGLDKGAVTGYTTGCSAEEQERLDGLSFSNLVATRFGPGDKTFLLGAHWESKRNATQDDASRPVLGANDGASGVGVLLQLMRELDGVDLPYSLQIVFFDGEDGFEDCHPLAGSLWFVEQLGPGAVDRMLLLDMVGDPDARFIRETKSQQCDPMLVDLLHSKAPSHGLADNFPGSRRSVLDDHTPFYEAGIPAVDLIDFDRAPEGRGHNFPPYWHTTQDTMENLDAGMLGRVGGLVLDVMQDPQFSATWPERC